VALHLDHIKLMRTATHCVFGVYYLGAGRGFTFPKYESCLGGWFRVGGLFVRAVA